MRLLGAVSVAAMAFGVLPISPVNAAIATTDACNASIPEDGFTDTGVDGTDVEDAVDCLVAYGITTGQSGTLYGTGGDVTRGQLATFVLNVLDQVDGFARPANAPDAFADDDGDTHEADINDAAALDLVKGFDDGTFGAGLPVQRDQMATYIINSLAEAGAPVAAATGDAFSDDDDSVHEGNINRLEAVDIVDGTVDGDYDPYRSVTRGTMAFFLTRTTEVLVDAGLIAPFSTTNQSFTVTPATKVTQTSSSTATYTDATTVQTVAASGLGAGAVNVALFPCAGANAPTTTAGIVKFTPPGGATPVAGSAVGQGTTNQGAANGILITSVNGAPVATAKQVLSVTPASGSVSVTLNNSNATPLDCAFVAIWRDGETPANSALTLGADGKPTEAFGINGGTQYLPAEHVAGLITSSAVTYVDKDATKFADASPATYNYKAADSYQVMIPAGGTCTNTTQADFLIKLSIGDLISGVYSLNAASTLCLDDVAPAAPATLTAAATTGATTMTLQWPDSTTASAASYNLYRRNVATGACPAFSTTGATPYTLLTNRPDGNLGAAGGATTTYVDATTAASTGYCYGIKTVDAGGSTGSASSITTNAVVTNAAAATATPYTTNMSFVTGGVGDNVNVLDTGDQIIGQFDSAITLPGAPTLTVMDLAQGDSFTISGANATFGVSGGTNNVLTVTLTGAPAVNTNPAGSDAVPTTNAAKGMAVTASNIGNANGAWNLARSGIPAAGFERVFGNNATEPTNTVGAGLSAAPVLANLNANDTANTVLTDASTFTTGDTATVYSQFLGATLGSKVIAAGGNDDSISTSGFALTDSLLVADTAVTTGIPSQTGVLVVAPFIVTAKTSDGNFNAPADTLTLTYSSTIVSAFAAPNAPTDAEVNALLGTVTGGTVFVSTFTSSVAGNVLTLTLATYTSGSVALTNTVAGGAVATITDGANNQVVAVTPVAAT